MSSEKVFTLGLKYRRGNPFIQYLAVKAHEQPRTSAAGEASGAALFVSGLPFGADEQTLSELFESFGAVSQAVLHPLKRSGIVVFRSDAGRTAALRFAAKGQVLEYDGGAVRHEDAEDGDAAEAPAGVKAWVHEFKAARPGNDVLQRQIDDWMDEFDAEQERKARERQAAMGEDGWTVVVRAKGRKRTREEDGVKVMTGGVAVNAAAAAAAAAAKDDKAGGLGDFYRFQRRERRRNELVELRQRFEDDRRRLAQLKAARNFKPF
ncbi:hypothetical protein PLESTB_000817900 [Pleodorina starrii]|uniref:RRM domain-containing protein n=1 Tax=Pleodorina starrii TaxID=330485 RepID=A0A9W6BKV4_9CHLO|nr:hypothetical protein PLESTM_000133700 [Pleodorina starrii]GLC54047.1 hypothetical protein PLESTB_000817900 [Pleodorina starrii]GLC64645.1 hypothetical protein PLESTF_000188200 [Pleodorina starrii]